MTDSGDHVEPARDAAHEVARKIKPQYADGDLVKVAWAENQAEAEMIQGLLLEEGIPSVARRARGFDVPDFLAGGPRQVFVPISGAEVARELLGAEPAPAPVESAEGELQRGLMIAAAVITALGATALVVWLALQSGP